MLINKKKFDFDIADVENFERYETALKNLQEKTANQPELTTNIERIKRSCEIVNEFFDDVLGDGASVEIFEGKLNFRTAYTVYEEFVSNCTKEFESITDTFSKYSPNRVK